jgi:hypothetical protein
LECAKFIPHIRIPQGSVLGPLLFIIYINDIPHLTKGRPIMYADDTSILNVGQDMNELQNTTSNNIGVVEQYFEINNLSINSSKRHYIPFQTRQCRQECYLKILVKIGKYQMLKVQISWG